MDHDSLAAQIGAVLMTPNASPQVRSHDATLLQAGLSALQLKIGNMRETLRSELSSGMELCVKSVAELFELFERLSEVVGVPLAQLRLPQEEAHESADQGEVHPDNSQDTKADEREMQIDARFVELERRLAVSEEARQNQAVLLEAVMNTLSAATSAPLDRPPTAAAHESSSDDQLTMRELSDQMIQSDSRRREEINELEGLRLRVDALTAEHTRRSKNDADHRRHTTTEMEELRQLVSCNMADNCAQLAAETEARKKKIDQVGQGMKMLARTISESTQMLDKMPAALKEHHQLMGASAPQPSAPAVSTTEHSADTRQLAAQQVELHTAVDSVKVAVTKLVVSHESCSKRCDRLLEKFATLQTNTSEQLLDVEEQHSQQRAQLTTLAASLHKVKHQLTAAPASPVPQQQQFLTPKPTKQDGTWHEQLQRLKSLQETLNPAGEVISA